MDFAPHTFEGHLLDHAASMDAGDLILLGHVVGCPCAGCKGIRKIGPRAYGNPLARMQAESALAESEAASEALAELAPKTPADRRKRAGVEARRIRLSAGVSRMLAAMQGRRVRNRKAGA